MSRHAICAVVAALLLQGALFLVAPRAFGQHSARFGGEGAYIETAHDSSLVTSQYTVEFWLRAYALGNPDDAGGEQTVLDRRGNTSGYEIRLAGTRWPISVHSVQNPDFGIGAWDAIVPHTWTHIAATQSEDRMRLYVNGVLRNEEEGSFTDSSDAPLRMGNLVFGEQTAYPFLGELDELRIWNFARDEMAIRATQYGSLDGTETGLVLYYTFEHVEADTVRDGSSWGNDGRIAGSVTFPVSDAPVGYVPLPPPSGLLAMGETNAIRLAWKPEPEGTGQYAVYRLGRIDDPSDASTWIDHVAATESTYVDTGASEGMDHTYTIRRLDPNGNPGWAGRPAASRRVDLTRPFLTGVYYEPRYGANGGAAWENDYVRSLLVPPQPPLLGHYDSRDPEVLRQHIAWMETFGIDFFISGGWTRMAWSTSVLLDLMPLLSDSPVKFAWLLRLGRYDNDGIFIDQRDIDSLQVEFDWAADHLFAHPSYLMHDGKHVVFVNASAAMTGPFQSGFDAIRQAMRDRGFELFLIADDVRWGLPNDAHFGIFDGVLEYQPLGQEHHYGHPRDTGYLGDLSVRTAEWEHFARSRGRLFVPTVLPGINRRTLAGSRSGIPRQRYPGAPSTSTLEDFIRVMRPFVDPETRMIVINSFNRWQYDTQIEPISLAAPTNQDASGTGNYTEGYWFEGDGMRPLEVVRDLLAPELAVSVMEDAPGRKDEDRLWVYPNPSAGSRTTVVWRTDGPGEAVLEAYDVLGRRVATILSGPFASGRHEVSWESGGLAPGVYFIVMRSGKRDVRRSLVHIGHR